MQDSLMPYRPMLYAMHGVLRQSHFQIMNFQDSGRTTLIKLLCGSFAPSSGTVIVFDYDVQKNTQIVQSFLNVCLHKDILLGYLNVIEHMRLIAKLKGVSSKKAEEELQNILEAVGLLSQSDNRMWELPRWQRRILCVAMSLIGDAPVLVLDEPTEGLDYDAKIQIWTILKRLKAEGKTILMSSSDIKDTNEVADKIVLMSRGRVAGVGAPSKFENIFETGYYLHIETVPNAKPDDILAFLKQHIPTAHVREGGLKRVKKAIEAKNWDQTPGTIAGDKSSKTIIKMPDALDDTSSKTEHENQLVSSLPAPSTQLVASTHATEISYLLPNRERANFPALLRALGDGKTTTNLGIKEYDLQSHNIENAFDEVDDYVDILDSGIDPNKESLFKDFLDYQTNAARARLLTNEIAHGSMPQHEFYSDTGCCSCCNELWALVIKKLCYIRGNHRHMCYQLMAPLLIVWISIKTTNVYFERDLWSPEIPYKSLTQLTLSEVPFRIDRNNDNNAKELLASFQKNVNALPNEIGNFKDIGTSKFSDHYSLANWHEHHVVVAADFTHVDDATSSKVVALFSPTQRHSAPLSSLVMFNSILDYEFLDNKYSIQMSARSMLTDRQHLILRNSKLGKSSVSPTVLVTLTVALAFGYFILASGFVTQPCAERLSHLKRYQMYNLRWNGLYWIANYLVDSLLCFVLIVLLTLMLYHVPTHDVLKNPQFIILFIITGVLGGFSSIIVSYCWSHYLRNYPTSFYTVLSINQFLGLFIFLFYTIINYDYFGKYVGEIVALSLQIIQPFTIPWNFHVDIVWALDKGTCKALHDIILEELCNTNIMYSPEIDNARKLCCSMDPISWSLDFISTGEFLTPLWSNFVILSMHCLGGVLVLMYIESKRRRRKLLHLLIKPEKAPALIDSKDQKSIENEALFIEEEILHLEKDVRDKLFIVDSLSTSIGSRTILHPMTFVCKPGHCLVVVGPETSGITTLYEILAGLRAISEGSVSYGGFSLFSWGSRKKLLQHLGLSPSRDISLDKLTGKQILELFGKLRHIPSDQLAHHVDYWVQRLRLTKNIKKQCESYSPIMKKKLNIACAVIGNPPVVIFDEPTKDLDPVSKSEVCSVITNLICDNRVVIILTHDLASVEHLCSKLIILVNGQMQFCESTENIYEEISDEFTLTVKLKGDDRGKMDFKKFSEFVTALEEKIESIILQEEQSQMLIYRIKKGKNQWADLFEIVNGVVKNHANVVLDYNIRQTSLADIYHSYSTKQRVLRAADSAWEEFLSSYC